MTGWLWCALGNLCRIFILRQVGKLLGTRVEVHLVTKNYHCLCTFHYYQNAILLHFTKKKFFFVLTRIIFSCRQGGEKMNCSQVLTITKTDQGLSFFFFFFRLFVITLFVIGSSNIDFKVSAVHSTPSPPASSQKYQMRTREKRISVKMRFGKSWAMRRGRSRRWMGGSVLGEAAAVAPAARRRERRPPAQREKKNFPRRKFTVRSL